MRRREFLGLLGGATAAWPLTANAQKSAGPIVGLLRTTPALPFAHVVTAIRQGLNDEGFVEDRNVTLEQRWADNQLDRLPALAADLVKREVSVIIGNENAVGIARGLTKNIQLVFVTGEDPLNRGLVTSMNRPEANLTGVTFYGGAQLNEKRLELLRDLVPKAKVVGVLGDPKNYPAFDVRLARLLEGGRSFGLQMVVMRVDQASDFETAFAKLVEARTDALMVSGSPMFTSNRQTLIALAARHAIPAIYDVREFVAEGGLISYSASFIDAYRQAGVYAGKILKGAKPAELPVLQPTKFELAVNLKTAKVLGLDVPPSIHLRADEVIE